MIDCAICDGSYLMIDTLDPSVTLVLILLFLNAFIGFLVHKHLPLFALCIFPGYLELFLGTRRAPCPHL